MMTPAVATASNTSPPMMKLMAPASEVTVNVRMPAGDRDSPSPFAALPFGTNQQADPECHREVQDHGIDV